MIGSYFHTCNSTGECDHFPQPSWVIDNYCTGCGKSFGTWAELERHRKVCEA